MRAKKEGWNISWSAWEEGFIPALSIAVVISAVAAAPSSLSATATAAIAATAFHLRPKEKIEKDQKIRKSKEREKKERKTFVGSFSVQKGKSSPHHTFSQRFFSSLVDRLRSRTSTSSSAQSLVRYLLYRTDLGPRAPTLHLLLSPTLQFNHPELTDHHLVVESKPDARSTSFVLSRRGAAATGGHDVALWRASTIAASLGTISG